MNTMQADQQETYTLIPTKKILLWLSMVSMVMLFAGLTSAYVVRQAEGEWTKFNFPIAFLISTGFIIASSISMQWSLNSVKKNELKHTTYGLIITLVLGFAFIFTQFIAWANLVAQDVFFVGNPSGSFLYVLTGLHIAHLVGGIIFLTYVCFRSLQKRYSSENHLDIELCSVYWHFLDGLWVYLVIFLYLIR